MPTLLERLNNWLRPKPELTPKEIEYIAKIGSWHPEECHMNFYKIPKEDLTESISYAAVLKDPHCIYNVPNELVSKRVLIAGVECDDCVPLFHLIYGENPVNIPDDIFMKAFSHNPDNIQYMPERLVNLQMVKEAIVYDTGNIFDIPAEFVNEEICLLAIRLSSQRDDSFVCKELMKMFSSKEMDQKIMEDVSKGNTRPFIFKYMDNSASILEGLNKWNFTSGQIMDIIKNIPKYLVDEKIATKLLKSNGNVYNYLGEEFQNQKYAKLAVESSGLGAVSENIYNEDLIRTHIFNRQPLHQLNSNKVNSLLTPELCLLITKNYPGKNLIRLVDDDKAQKGSSEKWNGYIDVKASVLEGKNLYTFDQELRKIRGINLTYPDIKKLYNGELIKFSKINIRNISYYNGFLEYDPTKELFKINGDRSFTNRLTSSKRKKI